MWGFFSVEASHHIPICTIFSQYILQHHVTFLFYFFPLHSFPRLLRILTIRWCRQMCRVSAVQMKIHCSQEWGWEQCEVLWATLPSRNTALIHDLTHGIMCVPLEAGAIAFSLFCNHSQVSSVLLLRAPQSRVGLSGGRCDFNYTGHLCRDRALFCG